MSDWFSTLTPGDLVGLLLTIATLILSFVVWRSSQRFARAQYLHGLQLAWNAYNTTVMSSDSNLEASSALYGPVGSDEDIETKRKYNLLFLSLNALQVAYLGGYHYKVLNKKYAEKNMRDLLAPLLRDPRVYDITQTRGYDPRFSEFCEQLKKREAAERSRDYA